MSVVNGSEFEISAKQLLTDLVTSTASKAFPDVYNHLTLLDFLEATSHPMFHHFHAQESCEPSVAISQARDLLKKWRCELKEGDYIDKYSAIDAGWYNAKVLSRTGDEIRVHYLNWKEKFDSDICIDDVTLIPYTARTKEHRVTKMGSKKTSKLARYQVFFVDPASSSADTDIASKASTDTVSELSLPLGVKADYRKNDLDDIVEGVENGTQSSSRIRRSSRAALSPSKMKENTSASKVIVLDETNASSLDEDSELGTDSAEGTFSSISSRNSGVEVEGEIIDLTERKEEVSKSLREREYSADNNEWICGHCGFLKSEDGTDLVLCDGPCLRSFHLGCLDAQSKKTYLASGDDEWRCKDCTAHTHSCFICRTKGLDHLEVTKCSRNNCGKYYHIACLEDLSAGFLQCEIKKSMGHVMLPVCVPKVAVKGRGKKRKMSSPGNSKNQMNSPNKDCSDAEDGEEDRKMKKDKVLMESQEVEIAQFMCPYHACHTCTPSDKCVKKKKKLSSQLYKCNLCPRAFHLNCIPPGARFSGATSCVVCPEHPLDPMPDRDVTRLSKTKAGGCAILEMWDQIPLSDTYPRADHPHDNHFRLPSHLQLEVQAQPAVFRMINKLDYESLGRPVPLNYPDEACCCVEKCGDDCLNRVSRVECCESLRPSGDDICPLGPECGNRVFEKKIYAKVERFQEYSMGWGLRATAPVDRGGLVIEYIGEVLDETQMQTRMSDQRKYTPNDHNFYIMQLDTGLFVDGKHKGNDSRFINHSCDPNCELQPWVVKGRVRIGIFAIKNIAAGEALSYDYQFDTNEEDIFKCYCQAYNCRGTMAPRKKMNKASLSRSERNKLLIAGRARDNKTKSMAQRVEEERSRSLTGKMLPGDGINEIRAGPPRSTFMIARFKSIFLPRNTKNCVNMLKRRRKEWARAEKAASC